MQSSIHVKNKIALVTGAAKGIGAATASMLAENGATVIVTDISAQEGQAVVDNIVANGGAAVFMALDVTQEEQWQKVINDVVEQQGGLDILVNNAGMVIHNGLLDISLQEWRRVHEVNLESVFLGTKHAVDVMRPGGISGRGGSIINLSSVGGMIGASDMSSYCSAKGGVRIFTKSAAVECGEKKYNVRVNSVHPGNTWTPMFEQEMQDMMDQGVVQTIDEGIKVFMDMQVLEEIGQPQDIASMILFLASDTARFITGAEFVVDGGLTAQ